MLVYNANFCIANLIVSAVTYKFVIVYEIFHNIYDIFHNIYTLLNILIKYFFIYFLYYLFLYIVIIILIIIFFTNFIFYNDVKSTTDAPLNEYAHPGDEIVTYSHVLFADK